MRTLGNILWLLLGGLWMALGYIFSGIVMFLLVVTIPFGIQAMKLGMFTLWPFGRTLVKRSDAGAASFLGNVLWFLLAGWWLALGHLVSAIVLAVTIIGIPFAVAHGKLALAALFPFGREIVPLSTLAEPAGAISVDRPTIERRGPAQLPPTSTSAPVGGDPELPPGERSA